MDYAALEVLRSPAWIAGPWGLRWAYAIGLSKDAWVSAAKTAVKLRFAALAPGDALGLLARELALGDGAERPLLLRAWELWTWAGTATGLRIALGALGYASVTLTEHVDERWWSFRVVLHPPFAWDPFVLPLARWTHGWRWGDGSRFVRLMPEGERERLRGVVARWSPAHAVCTEIVVLVEGRLWCDGFRFGDGTAWGGLAARF